MSHRKLLPGRWAQGSESLDIRGGGEMDLSRKSERSEIGENILVTQSGCFKNSQSGRVN